MIGKLQPQCLSVCFGPDFLFFWKAGWRTACFQGHVTSSLSLSSSLCISVCLSNTIQSPSEIEHLITTWLHLLMHLSFNIIECMLSLCYNTVSHFHAIQPTLCFNSLDLLRLNFKKRNEIRLKKSNRVAALLCVSDTDTKLKGKITLGTLTVKKVPVYIQCTNEQAFSKGLLKVMQSCGDTV